MNGAFHAEHVTWGFTFLLSHLTHIMPCLPCLTHKAPGGAPDFKWWRWLNGGKNQNPKKSLDQISTPPKIPQQICEPKFAIGWILFAELRGNKVATNLQIVLNTRKNPPPLKKKNCQIFPPKKSLDHPHHLKSRVKPLGIKLNNSSKNLLESMRQMWSNSSWMTVEWLTWVCQKR